MSAPGDYLWDRSGPADPEVARLEALLAPLAHDRPLDELRLRRARGPRWIAPAVTAALACAAAVLVLVLRPAPERDPCAGGDGFAFTAVGGTVGCNGGRLARGVLPVGGTLDTGSASAELAIADIGRAELAPNTRLSLVQSTANQRQQLHLDRGKMHARVTAPPRIFAVTTPSTSVTDLGCEYTIEIDDKGRGTIDVQDGKVELETAAGAVIVAPAGTSARLLEDRRPSLPFAAHATAELRAAIAAYEQGDTGALDRVVALAGPGDAITLANLAYLVPAQGSERERVLVRLADLAPPAPGITVRDALVDPRALDAWREDVVLAYIVESIEQK